MKFNSQICTTRSQSERLLALGLKKETADMAHVGFGGGNFMNRPYEWLSTSEIDMEGFIPAWSLHRLIEMLPTYIDVVGDEWTLNIIQGKLVVYTTDEKDDFLVTQGTISLYESIIATIEWLIQGGHFNKDYLEG